MSFNKWEWLCLGKNDFNQFQFKCVRKWLELTEPQASLRNLLHLEQYLRFVNLLDTSICIWDFWDFHHVGFFGFVLILIKIYLFHSIWVSIQSTDSLTNQSLHAFTDLLRFYCLSLRSMMKKGSLGTVGKISLVKKRLGPGYSKS